MVLLCGVGDKEDALVEEEKPRKTNSSWPRVASLAECSPGVTLLALINSSSSSFLRELGLAHTVSPPNSRWRRLGFLYMLLSISTITRVNSEIDRRCAPVLCTQRVHGRALDSLDTTILSLHGIVCSSFF
jgi:hypothetical protein